MNRLDQISQWLSRLLLWIAAGFLAAMIFLTCANILLRIVWKPVSGTFELMGYFGAVATAFALAYTQLNKGHIAVDVLSQRFSPGMQRVLGGVNALMGTVFFALVTWRIAAYATVLRKSGEVTETLRIPYYPFTYGVALGCGVLSLIFLVEFVRSFHLEEGAS